MEGGKRIYREGRLPSGAPLRGEVLPGTELSGERAACTSCHGRSGLGYGEGQIIPPAISAPILFEPRVIERRELYASRHEGPGTRPAYTEETLARAIREGIDATGAQMDVPMPRYALSDTEMASLLGYLRTLGASASPGVTESELRFATVVTEGVAPHRRKAMLDVLAAFVEAKNAETRNEERRAQARGAIQVQREQRAYRKWVIDVWELRGLPDTWHEQLHTQYQARPVFALLSGVGAGSWAPVHEFCRDLEIPCVLPNTDLPDGDGDGFYSLYFSGGLPLEARVLARYLTGADGVPAGDIVQIYREDDPLEAAAARALRLSLGPEAKLEDVPVSGSAYAETWKVALEDGPALAVLWLRDAELSELGALGEAPTGLRTIYLSTTLVEDPAASVPPSMRSRTRLVHPYGLPEVQDSRLRPALTWLRSRGVEAKDARIQSNAYFAARAVGEALMHMTGNFSRDYLIEKLEHRLGNLPWASVYSSVGLASGQRFLSKGAYVVRLQEDPSEPRVVAVSDWIIP